MTWMGEGQVLDLLEQLKTLEIFFLILGVWI